MEKLIKKSLHQHYSTLDLLSTSQHGFHPARSCITNLQLARELWVSAVDAGSRLDVIFVDFSKAFDKVPHERLLYKLQRIGLTGNLLCWIHDFLCGRTLRVRVNDRLSPEIAVTSGVPQGSVLGPELFKIFINDLPATLGVTCLAYADDLKLWTVVTCRERARALQQALNLHQWTSQWLLPVTQPAVYPQTKGEAILLQSVQNRATKRVPELRHLSYEQRLKSHNLFSLTYRRRRADLIYVRRILLNICGSEPESFFHFNTNTTRGHEMRLFKRRTGRLPLKATLSTRVVNDWNHLPSGVILSTSELTFKSAVDRQFESEWISPP